MFNFITPRFALLANLLVSAALLAGAHSFEKFGGLPPCPLCLDQREWHWAILSVAFVAVLAYQFAPKPFLKKLALAAFAILAILAGLSAYAGGFHAGVEYGWWPGPETCTGDMTIRTADSLLDAFNNADKKIIRCDETPWSLFGISMAGYNFLISLDMFLGNLLMLWLVFTGKRATT